MAKAAIKVEGLKPLLRDMTNLSKESQKAVREGSKRIADKIAGDVRSHGATAQAVPLTDSARASAGRIPSLTFGSESKSGLSGGARVSDLMGANFGAHPPSQFPRISRPDYYVYREIEHQSRWITEQWIELLARQVRKVDPAFTGRA